jgi:hypothetical protein
MESLLPVISPLSRVLKANVFGQDGAIDEILSSIERHKEDKAALKPLAILMSGSSAVEKIELAKSLSDALLGEDGMIWIEMMNEEDGPKTRESLFGWSGGDGPESVGLIIGALRENQRRIVLLDGIEKCSRQTRVAIGHALNDGFVIDHQSGEKISLKETIFLMTAVTVDRLDELRYVMPEELATAITAVVRIAPLNDDTFCQTLYARFRGMALQEGLILSDVEKRFYAFALRTAYLKEKDYRTVASEFAIRLAPMFATAKKMGAHQVEIVLGEVASVANLVGLKLNDWPGNGLIHYFLSQDASEAIPSRPSIIGRRLI